uniref:Uncharacterized protein n=1 Tax=Romanomermis culicivorax TaxID=13658 RepID=A0A915L5D1_ROMCU
MLQTNHSNETTHTCTQGTDKTTDMSTSLKSLIPHGFMLRNWEKTTLLFDFVARARNRDRPNVRFATQLLDLLAHLLDLAHIVEKLEILSNKALEIHFRKTNQYFSQRPKDYRYALPPAPQFFSRRPFGHLAKE